MIQVFTLWMDACSLKLIGEPMNQVSSFTFCTLIMMQTEGFLHPRTVGRTKQRTSSTPVIEFWTFIPLFLFFNRFQFFQDASAQVTEGLVLKV